MSSIDKLHKGAAKEFQPLTPEQREEAAQDCAAQCTIYSLLKLTLIVVNILAVSGLITSTSDLAITSMALLAPKMFLHLKNLCLCNTGEKKPIEKVALFLNIIGMGLFFALNSFALAHPDSISISDLGGLNLGIGVGSALLPF